MDGQIYGRTELLEGDVSSTLARYNYSEFRAKATLPIQYSPRQVLNSTLCLLARMAEYWEKAVEKLMPMLFTL